MWSILIVFTCPYIYSSMYILFHSQWHSNFNFTRFQAFICNVECTFEVTIEWLANAWTNYELVIECFTVHNTNAYTVAYIIYRHGICKLQVCMSVVNRWTQFHRTLLARPLCILSKLLSFDLIHNTVPFVFSLLHCAPRPFVHGTPFDISLQVPPTPPLFLYVTLYTLVC